MQNSFLGNWEKRSSMGGDIRVVSIIRYREGTGSERERNQHPDTGTCVCRLLLVDRIPCVIVHLTNPISHVIWSAGFSRSLFPYYLLGSIISCLTLIYHSESINELLNGSQVDFHTGESALYVCTYSMLFLFYHSISDVIFTLSIKILELLK